MRKLLGGFIFAIFMIVTVPLVAAQEVGMDTMRLCMQGMDTMDVDEDGAISKIEFMQANEELFAAMDNDGDGALGAEEREMTTGQVLDALLAGAGMLWNTLWGLIFG